MAIVHAMAIPPEVCQLNEGHAAFAVLERARSFVKKTGHPFEVALAVTRAGQPLHHPHGGGRGV
jgi:glycogen phosphorylase